jgi:hypothetical protein
MTLAPGTVDHTMAGLLAVNLIGDAKTKWSGGTAWTVSATGVSITGSTISVGGPTRAAWAVLLGKTKGSVTIADDKGNSAILMVL